MFGRNKNKFINREKIKAQGERKKKSNPRFSSSRIIFDILAGAFLAATFYILFFSAFLKIEKITLSGIEELDYGKILEHIQSPMEGNYLRFIPKNNLILVLKKNIANDLLSSFKKIRSVEVKKIFPNGLEINISERTALLIFCKKEAVNGNCYIMDEKGVIYTEADLSSQEVAENKLITIIDTSGKEIKIGDNIFGEKDIRFIGDVQKQLGSIEGVEFDSVYSTPSRLAGEFRITAKNGMQLFISSEIPLEETANVLKIFLKKEADGQKREFEHIDLRTENKVYYKVKGEAEEKKEEEEKK